MRNKRHPYSCATNIKGEYEDYKVSIQGSGVRIKDGSILTDEETDQYEKEVSLFPNPNSGIFELDFEGTYENEIEVTIRAVDGRIVYSKTIQAESFFNRLDLDISSHAKGMYILQVREGKFVRTIKFNRL